MLIQLVANRQDRGAERPMVRQWPSVLWCRARSGVVAGGTLGEGWGQRGGVAVWAIKINYAARMFG